ncbi:hypothetical protein CDEST_03465 [Colletotrichum destructivum]|uniref:Uncharacterized protein n=1 Tax=Colletotrichum destructivum TaxID=34406 RepID=A0AAX4I5H7_9PEZI|nr:hypothetical protein CDEST_03465 [Colletotrichum destructivum]
MAPVIPISGAGSGLAPTRTLTQPLRALLARQVVTTVTATPETTEESASNELSGGAIAGIVIGSIAGFLLLLWIVKSCGMWSRPSDWSEKDHPYDDRRRRGRSPGARHRRRHQRRYHHETSRSKHRRPSYEIDEVRYSQPVAYETRRPSASPLPPANVYRSSRSRTRY